MIRIIIDETIDVGVYQFEWYSVSTLEIDLCLIYSEELAKINYSTIISTLFDNCIRLMDIERDHVLLFVTDVAQYMIKLATALRESYTPI